MENIWSALGIDINKNKKREREKKRDLEYTKYSIKSGSGEKSDGLKLYNKYRKQFGKEPITVREYLKDPIIQDEIESIEFEVFCTMDFFKKVFITPIEQSMAVKVADHRYVTYYIEGMNQMDDKIDRYNSILCAIRTAPSITSVKLNSTIQVLKQLEETIPDILGYVKHFHENYAKNQQRKALEDAIRSIFPEITEKNIIKEIAANNL